MSHRPFAVIVLAAGEGTRMKSATPKVLHQVAGRSLLGHVVEAAAHVEPEHVVVVVGHGREQVTEHCFGATQLWIDGEVLDEEAPGLGCYGVESGEGMPPPVVASPG